MELVDYLIALDGGNHAAPDKLVLPGQFVAELGKLYTAAEHEGREHGCALICDRASRTLSYGQIAKGLPTSMNIPVSTHANNFGNVHAHPSASIGHAGGYSAHSMQDLAKFADTRTKPYFFQFVISGPRIYAMVQVNGVSVWDPTVAPFLSNRHHDQEGQMLGAVVAAAGGEAAYVARRDALGPNPEDHEPLMTQLKTQANIGKLMQPLSIQNCTAFAQTYHYFFYVGEDTFLTKTG
jgi:hypothetical protein